MTAYAAVGRATCAIDRWVEPGVELGVGWRRLESDAAATRELRPCWNPMLDEVLTIKEVAALLKLAEKTVYAMAQAGESPALRSAGSRSSEVTKATCPSSRTSCACG